MVNREWRIVRCVFVNRRSARALLFDVRNEFEQLAGLCVGWIPGCGKDFFGDLGLEDRIGDVEVRGNSNSYAVLPEQSCACAVKSADVQAGSARVRQQVICALPNFNGRLLRERDGENGCRVNVLFLDTPRKPPHECRRFAGSRSGEDERWSALSSDCLSLLHIQVCEQWMRFVLRRLRLNSGWCVFRCRFFDLWPCGSLPLRLLFFWFFAHIEQCHLPVCLLSILLCDRLDNAVDAIVPADRIDPSRANSLDPPGQERRGESGQLIKRGFRQN